MGDTVIYWWILLSLMRTISSLRLRKQEIKLQMYSRFLFVLVMSGVLSVLIVVYQTLLVLTHEEDAMWSSWWTFQAFWQGLYFVLLVAMAIIWRPTENNMRFASESLHDVEGGPTDEGPMTCCDLDAISHNFL